MIWLGIITMGCWRFRVVRAEVLTGAEFAVEGAAATLAARGAAATIVAREVRFARDGAKV